MTIKRILTVVLLLVIAAGLSAAIAYKHWNAFLDAPLTVDAGGESFTIEPGTPFVRVSENLERRGALSNATWFSWYARWTGMASQIQAGEYLIAPGTSPRELLTQFTSGQVRLYSFTIIEGWNVRELLAALQAHSQVVTTMSDEDWPAVLAELGIEHTHPEGMFLPETYRFQAGTKDREILAQAHEFLQQVLAEEWQDKHESAPAETPYEALILASIVEKETGRADERARIAGVFARRLAKGMRLQTDPTVIYGIGASFNGDITRRDLRTDTPYNTYTRHGLPPTPIAMAGRAAIHAALNPEDGEALYFVATGKGDGSHTFSVTNAEHELAVQEYLQRLRRQN